MGWREEANCLGSNNPAFVAEERKMDRKERRAALALCFDCKVIDRCLVQGMTQLELGIWGGTLPSERRRIKRRRR